jgi:hypothetical protein
VAVVRRVGVVLLLALAGVAGCGTRSATLPGAAAPLTRTGTVTPGPTTRTPAPASPTRTADGPSADGPSADSPTPTALPAVPTDFRTVTTSGFGVTVALPVPAGWARTPSTSAGLIRTDVDLVNPEVLLRVDLSARGAGSAQDAAIRNESATRLSAYRRIGITRVPGVGDDAVDWAFTFQRDGTRQVVDRQILSGQAAVAVYYSAPGELYQRYLAVWERAVRGLSITTS